MKPTPRKSRCSSARLWAQPILLLFAFPAICSATPPAPTYLDFKIINASLTAPGATPKVPAVTLYWSNSSEATVDDTYTVCVSATSGSGYTPVSNGTLQYTASSTPTFSYMLTAAQTWPLYYVISIDDVKCVTPTDYSTQITVAPPALPTSITVAAGTIKNSNPALSNIKVSWTTNSTSYAPYYTVYRSTSGGPYASVSSPIAYASGTMSYTDGGTDQTGLVNGTAASPMQYTYMVEAVGGTGNISTNDPANSANPTVNLSGVPSGPALSITSVTPGTPTTVALQWAATPGSTAYEILRYDATAGGPWTNLLGGNNTQAATTYVDTSAPTNDIMFYEILPFAGSTQGTPTNPAIAVSTYVTQYKVNTTAAGMSGIKVTNWSYDVKQQLSQIPQTQQDLVQQDLECAWGGNLYGAKTCATANESNGASMFDSIREAWYPQYALVPSPRGTPVALSPVASASLDYEATNAAYVMSQDSTKSYSIFLSPKSTGIDTSYYDSTTGTAPFQINPALWANAMLWSRIYYQTVDSQNILYNGIENEGDNTNCQFLSTNWNAIYQELGTNWPNIVQVGPDSFRSGDSALWLGYFTQNNAAPSQPISTCETPSAITPINVNSQIIHASTHAIGGTLLSDFEDFLGTADQDSLGIWLSEIHSLAEPLVALNYPANRTGKVARGVWWSPITPVRGDFMYDSKYYPQISSQFAADGAASGASAGFAVASAYYNAADSTGISVFLANNSLALLGSIGNPGSTVTEVPVWETFSITCTNSQGCAYNQPAINGTSTSPYVVLQPSADNPAGEQEIFVAW